MDIIPFEGISTDDISNESNEVDHACGHIKVNGETRCKLFISEDDDEQCVKSFRTIACGYVIDGEVCGDMFASAVDLKSHMNRTHYRENPYTYDEVNKTFTKDNPFKSQKGKPYFCDKSVGDGICGKSFSGRDVFRQHFRTHGDGKFLCEYPVNGEPCGKRFASQYNLDKHTWIHRTHAIRSIKEMSPDRIRYLLNTQPTTQVTF